MSQENVALVQRSLAAWQRDDFDSWLATLDLAMEWHTVFERLVEGIESFYQGHDGMRRMWKVYRTEFKALEVEAQEFRDLRDEHVVLLSHFRWRGPASGIVIESPLGQVFTIRDGKIVRSMDYLSHADALKAVGLEE